MGPIIQIIDDKSKVEKEMYSQYNKARNTYNNCKVNLDKTKKEYESNAKIFEKKF